MWCSGDGSWGNPYIIENVTIDASSSPTGSGIFINNSKNEYFRIENCTIFNVGAGQTNAAIKLDHTENGTLFDNNCSNNQQLGIFLYNNCINNTISNNTIANNLDRGIWILNQCLNNTIANNTLLNNNNGIFIDSEGNKVYNNFINHHNDGIYCSNTNNLIRNNTIVNSIDGFFIESATYNTIIFNKILNSTNLGIGLTEWAFYNSISDNIIKNASSGIHFDVARYNNVSQNIFANCSYGVYTTGWMNENNTFYLNTFKDNGVHAEDNMNLNDNKWDNGAIGNYWDDYLTMGAGAVDADDDGIGDIPYTNIAGSANSQDNFPIWDDGDDLGPDITINSPSNSSSHSDAPTFTITIIDQSPINKTWYSVNNGTGWSQSITFTGTSIIINGTLWGNLNNGTVLIRFFANDSAGNMNYKDALIEKIPPPPDDDDDDDDGDGKEPTIPGYTFITLITIVSIINIIHRTKKKLNKNQI